MESERTVIRKSDPNRCDLPEPTARGLKYLKYFDTNTLANLAYADAMCRILVSTSIKSESVSIKNESTSFKLRNMIGKMMVWPINC